MKVFEIMSDRVAAIEPTASAATARQMMRTKGIHHLVVLRDGTLEGIISSRDIPDAATRGRRGGQAVEELMQRDVVTVGPNSTVAKAANVMTGHSIGSLVVTTRGQMAGIVTVSDLLTLVAHGAGRQPKRAARPLLKHTVPHRKQRGAGKAW